MEEDYRVKGRSNLECRELAKKLRDFFGGGDLGDCAISAVFKHFPPRAMALTVALFHVLLRVTWE